MVYGNYLDEVLMVAGYYNYYYAHDHLYSPVALLSIDGGILERYEYDAYGRRNVFENDFDARSGSHYGLPIAFTGQRIDVLDGGDLEVMYYKNRYYDVEMGRFLTRDPIGYADGMNIYQYAHSNPINKEDKDGRIAIQITVAVIAATCSVVTATITYFASRQDCTPGDMKTVQAEEIIGTTTQRIECDNGDCHPATTKIVEVSVTRPCSVTLKCFDRWWPAANEWRVWNSTCNHSKKDPSWDD